MHCRRPKPLLRAYPLISSLSLSNTVENTAADGRRADCKVALPVPCDTRSRTGFGQPAATVESVACASRPVGRLKKIANALDLHGQC